MNDTTLMLVWFDKTKEIQGKMKINPSKVVGIKMIFNANML